MTEQRPCVECGETIPEQRAKRPACVTCSKPCEEDHRRATTSRAARAKRKKAKKPRHVLLKVDEHVASTFKQAAQAAGLSQNEWAGLIVEVLLEDDHTARGWALQRCLATAEPVARGADSIHVRLPVLWAAKVEEHAAHDGQKPATWLRTICYWASVFADEWHLTGTAERLKLKYKFKAHDRDAQAHTSKEEGVLLRVDEHMASTFKQAAQAAGLSPTDWGRLNRGEAAGRRPDGAGLGLATVLGPRRAGGPRCRLDPGAPARVVGSEGGRARRPRRPKAGDLA